MHASIHNVKKVTLGPAQQIEYDGGATATWRTMTVENGYGEKFELVLFGESENLELQHG